MKNKYKNEYNSLLKEHFNYDELKEEQLEIIYNIVKKKKDVLAILATGFGKSVCYQIPFLVTNKCVIVISPLISLMEDQMKQLDELEIPNCCFNETTAWKNGFREVSKLVYWNNKTPTVETNFRIKKWLGCNNKWLKQGAEDGKKFTIDKAYDIDAIQQTYYWDFCRNYFKEKYPTETFY